MDNSLKCFVCNPELNYKVDKSIINGFQLILSGLWKEHENVETNLKENKILLEKNSKLEDKIVYLQKEIECYKKEINSVQEKHNLEKSRSAQYKNKFLSIQQQLIVMNKKNKDLKMLFKANSSSNEISSNIKEDFPFALKSKPKTNRIVLVPNTCRLQIDNSENCKKNENDQKNLYKNTSTFEKTSVKNPNDMKLSSRKSFDPDETVIPVGSLKRPYQATYNNQTSNTKIPLSIPDTPEKVNKVVKIMEETRLSSSNESKKSDRESPSLLQSSKWLKRPKIKKPISMQAQNKNIDGSNDTSNKTSNASSKNVESTVAFSFEDKNSSDENNEKLSTSLENLFDKTTGVFCSKSVLQNETLEKNKNMQKTNLKACTPENFKYDKVTRGRANRDLLDGKECQQCINYYSDLPAEERAEKLRHICKHKKVYHPPDTPECYWKLGIPDTEECLRTGLIKEETTPPIRAPRCRRKPYKANFISK